LEEGVWRRIASEWILLGRTGLEEGCAEKTELDGVGLAGLPGSRISADKALKET
jgi:hypothetical protein